MKGILVALIFVVAIAIALMALRLSPSETPEFDKMHSEEIEMDGLTMTVKVADVPPEWSAGFQNVPPDVIEQTALLFVYPSAENRTFHMRNVAAPLDIAFADSDGIIFQIQRMELGDTLYSSNQPTMYALEAAAGFFSEHNITEGSKVYIQKH
jgi:hypothetical protein